jgi:hypothetical protein
MQAGRRAFRAGAQTHSPNPRTAGACFRAGRGGRSAGNPRTRHVLPLPKSAADGGAPRAPRAPRFARVADHRAWRERPRRRRPCGGRGRAVTPNRLDQASRRSQAAAVLSSRRLGHQSGGENDARDPAHLFRDGRKILGAECSLVSGGPGRFDCGHVRTISLLQPRARVVRGESVGDGPRVRLIAGAGYGPISDRSVAVESASGVALLAQSGVAGSSPVALVR